MLYFKEKTLWFYLVDLPWLGMCVLGLVVRPILYSMYSKICCCLYLAALNLDVQHYEETLDVAALLVFLVSSEL